MALAALVKADLHHKIETSLESEFLKPLRKLIEDDSELKCRTDTEFLVRFLRARDFKVERAFELIQNYFKQRQDPEFCKLYPSQLEAVKASNFLRVLKHRDSEGRHLIWTHYAKWNTEDYDGVHWARYYMLLLEEVTQIAETQEKGIILLVDHDGFSMSHVTNLPLRIIRMLANVFRNSFPMKLKGVHMLNNPAIYDLFWNIAKHLLSDKIRERIALHYDASGLLEHFDESILPKSLGGTLNDDEAVDNKLIDNMMLRDDYYKEQLSYGYGFREREAEKDDDEHAFNLQKSEL